MRLQPNLAAIETRLLFSCSNIIPEKVLLQHLHSLESHTSLYFLHHLTNLVALNEEAVTELLQGIPARDTEQAQGKLGAGGEMAVTMTKFPSNLFVGYTIVCHGKKSFASIFF